MKYTRLTQVVVRPFVITSASLALLVGCGSTGDTSYDYLTPGGSFMGEFQTPAAQMPVTGSVRYYGSLKNSTSPVYSGSVQLDVDFASGQARLSGQNLFSEHRGFVAGSQIVGNDGPFSIRGRFYGPSAEHAAGTMGSSSLSTSQGSSFGSVTYEPKANFEVSR